MKKRILSLLLSLVMVVSLLPVTAYAALPTMTAQIDGDYLKWDAVDGANVYCLLIDYKAEYVKAQKTGGVQNAQQSFDLESYCKTRYPNRPLKVQIKAYSNYPASGGTALTELYTVEGSYQNTAATVTQLTTPANIQWSGFTVSWNAVDHATKYRVVLTREYYVLGTSYSENYYVIETTTPSVDIKNYCVPDITDYRLSITAMTTKAGCINSEPGYAYKRYTDAELSTLPTRELQNVNFNESTGVLSWDAFNTATTSYLLQVFARDYSGYIFSAKTTIPAASGSMTFDVKNFCIEKGLPSVDGTGFPASNYRVLLSACDATGDRISAAWLKDDYILNYSGERLSGEVSYSGAARYGTTLTANVSGAPNDAALKYQWQYKDSGAWKDISSATAQAYSPNDDAGTMVGKEIRVKVTATNYAGTLYGASKTVTKAAAPGAPGAPALSVTTEGNTATVTFTPVETAEYIYKVVSDTDETLTAWPDSGYISITGGSFTVEQTNSDQIVRVYTRYKETPTRRAGTHLSGSKIIIPAIPASSGGDGSSSGTPSDVAANSLIYPDYDTTMPTVYVKKGETVTVRYQLTPANANTNLPRWEEDTMGGESCLSIQRNSHDATTGIGSIEITGNAVKNSAVVKVYKGDSTTDLFGTYTITVVVYDDNLDSIAFPPSTTLEAINMYVGDSTQLDLDGLKDELNFLPAGVSKDGYTLKAYILQSGSGAGSVPSYVESNDKISINPETGVITANAVGDGSMVYVVALASGETASVTKYIATLTVNVAAKPAAEPELTVAPGAATLWSDKTYQLAATKTPADAAGDITWSSSDTDVATVDNTGKVTAVAAGTATITATCGSLTATCTVTVKAKCADNAHTFTYIATDEYEHTATCLICDYSYVQMHIMEAYSTANGSGYVCLFCGYTVPNTPTDPTPDNPDSSSGGSSGAGRPYRHGLSTAVPEGTTGTAADSTTTVLSPGTGDAGIVLYAALSLMSMTGGAWLVSKKRRDR